MRAATHSARPAGQFARHALGRFVAAVDEEPTARDALALASSLADASGADLMVVTVVPDLGLFIPEADFEALRREARHALARLVAEVAPGARVEVGRDLSVARGIRRAVRRYRRGMLVIGSRHDAPQGQVGIAVHARQLIDRLPCPLLIAPRGYSEAPHPPSRIGVAIDGGQESAQALEVAARLAAATGAELVACGAVSDRPPAFGWSTVSSSRTHETWTHALDARCDALTARIEEMTEPLRGEVSIEVERGRPAEVLRAFSGRVDLLVIGSRRWGPLARLVLGGTGEALANGSRCPLLLTPRPASGRDAHDRHD